MIKFGPSGFCEDFLKEHSHTAEIPKWVKEHGLSAFEYAFNNGIHLSDEKAEQFKTLFEKAGIELSVHGPYYINLANPDETMADKSKAYIISSFQKMKKMGAKKLVIHAGTMMKLTRDEAMSLILKRLHEVVALLDEYGFDDVYLCPETMGKHGQVGTVEEVAQMCAIDPRIIPTLDFGHINAYGLGSLKTKEDFENVFLTLKKYLGDRFKKVHIHFSKVMYGAKGELKHLNFDDDPDNYGPDFNLLAKVLKEMDIEGTVICESRGNQTKDAVTMRNIFQKIN